MSPEVLPRQTAAHGKRTCALAADIGRSLGFLSHELRVLELAALVHDLGKIGIP